MNMNESAPNVVKHGMHVNRCEKCGRQEIVNARCICGHLQTNRKRLTLEELGNFQEFVAH